LKEKAEEFFPNGDVGFVWYTLGGNDRGDESFTLCSAAATTPDEMRVCLESLTQSIVQCSTVLISELWRGFPSTKVVQVGYDLPCHKPGDNTMFPVCGTDIECFNKLAIAWNDGHLAEMTSRLDHRYSGISVMGATQVGGQVDGAQVGKPVLTEGSPCHLMGGSVHPIWPLAGSTTIGEYMWQEYFSLFL
jgi:hypothetical protein